MAEPSVQVGADLRHATNLRIPSDANRTGQMHFNWQGPVITVLAALTWQHFVLGSDNMDRYVGSPTETKAIETQNRYFFYAQDTWRATHKLTVNYGCDGSITLRNL